MEAVGRARSPGIRIFKCIYCVFKFYIPSFHRFPPAWPFCPALAAVSQMSLNRLNSAPLLPAKQSR